MEVSKDELLRLFQILWDDHQLFLYGLTNVTDELERLVETNREQKQRLSGLGHEFLFRSGTRCTDEESA